MRATGDGKFMANERRRHSIERASCDEGLIREEEPFGVGNCLGVGGAQLSEMLLALVAMLVIAALIVPLFLFSNDFQEVNERRNAQMLAAVSYRTYAGGVPWKE